MIDALVLVKAASVGQKIYHNDLNVIEEPALIRQVSGSVINHYPKLAIKFDANMLEKEDSQNNVIKTEDGFCKKTHKSCGHRCFGVQDEKKCLPCLD